jgi:hypothetical protein
MVKLRQDNPLFTVAGLTEITIYGDSQEREGDFLAAAAQILHCSQAEVDEAAAFTGETTSQPTDQANPTLQRLTEAINLLVRYQAVTIQSDDAAHDALWDDAARFLAAHAYMPPPAPPDIDGLLKKSL